jgi:hypothetical protein
MTVRGEGGSLLTPSFFHPAPPATHFSNYIKGCPVLVPAGPRFSICYNRAAVEQTDAVGIISKEQETGITYIKMKIMKMSFTHLF